MNKIAIAQPGTGFQLPSNRNFDLPTPMPTSFQPPFQPLPTSFQPPAFQPPIPPAGWKRRQGSAWGALAALHRTSRRLSSAERSRSCGTGQAGHSGRTPVHHSGRNANRTLTFAIGIGEFCQGLLSAPKGTFRGQYAGARASATAQSLGSFLVANGNALRRQRRAAHPDFSDQLTCACATGRGFEMMPPAMLVGIGAGYKASHLAKDSASRLLASVSKAPPCWSAP
jgi:hypothetical protein